MGEADTFDLAVKPYGLGQSLLHTRRDSRIGGSLVFLPFLFDREG